MSDWKICCLVRELLPQYYEASVDKIRSTFTLMLQNLRPDNFETVLGKPVTVNRNRCYVETSEHKNGVWYLKFCIPIETINGVPVEFSCHNSTIRQWETNTSAHRLMLQIADQFNLVPPRGVKQVNGPNGCRQKRTHEYHEADDSDESDTHEDHTSTNFIEYDCKCTGYSSVQPVKDNNIELLEKVMANVNI